MNQDRDVLEEGECIYRPSHFKPAHGSEAGQTIEPKEICGNCKDYNFHHTNTSDLRVGKCSIQKDKEKK
jgi:hypothetical protein